MRGTRGLLSSSRSVCFMLAGVLPMSVFAVGFVPNRNDFDAWSGCLLERSQLSDAPRVRAVRL